MNTLSARNLEPVLAVAAKLAAPFDLTTMLSEVAEAAKRVLDAARCTVWLYDRATEELVLRIAEDVPPLRIPTGTGLVGTCARTRRLINVPDCYADARFDPVTDKRTGFRTRCMLSLPLFDHRNELVGVMQVLNKADGVFDDSDEALATVLAAQCGVALQRARMTEAMIESEKLRQELEMARIVQMSTLPAAMPSIPGYDVFGTFRPADLTGGDTFDLARVGKELLVVLADAAGHGIGPALSVTQLQAMLRMAFRLGADLETAFVQVNNQLSEILPGDRFITAFIGLLDPATHRLRFHSGGQGPILHLRAASGACERHLPTSFPLAALPMQALDANPVTLPMEPGDVLALISDGILEQHDAAGAMFGEERALEVLRTHHRGSMQELSARLFDAVAAFAGGVTQEDDMTVVLLRRDAATVARRAFERRIGSLGEIVAFTRERFAAARIDPGALPATDFAIEELFTNMLKYGNPRATVTLEIAAIDHGVEVTIVEDDADRFDPRGAPAVDVAAPIGEREPGGLGLHVLRRMVDSLEYRYLEDKRQGRTTFRKTLPGAKGDATNARD